jgi:hypothetical protein
MFLDLRILNELRTAFLQVQILKGLLPERHLAVGGQSDQGVSRAFELMFLITRRRITL